MRKGVNNGADVKIKGEPNSIPMSAYMTPLVAACRYRDVDIVNLLLEKIGNAPGEINHCVPYVGSALFVAETMSKEIAEILRNKQAKSIMCTTLKGGTGNQLATVSLLFESGQKKNRKLMGHNTTNRNNRNKMKQTTKRSKRNRKTLRKRYYHNKTR